MEQRKLIVRFSGRNKIADTAKEVAIKEVITYLENYDKQLKKDKIPVTIIIEDITNII
jgi:hypothetical protein